MMFKHEIGYNSQIDNDDFKGRFSGWRQCFTTSAWMFMSFYSKNIAAEDDFDLSVYFDDVEASVGTPGIGEKIKRKYKWITGSTSLWWLTQKEGVEKWLWKNGVEGDALFCEEDEFPNFYALLRHGPVILGTKKIGGLRGGHIILLTGFEKNGDYIVHDPFGDATTNYANRNGECVIYPESMLRKHTGKIVRCMYWR
ncbi:hypothetical protein KAR91_29830 [Candidatus Pacearchaeota archaeon]|nr:hypothetical protein [Candidatus Pacearchaeota archaeon]